MICCRRLPGLLAITLAVLWAGACRNNTIRSAEGQLCTTNGEEDPQYVCSPGEDLVCITSYSIEVTEPRARMKFDGGVREVWLCRLFCEPGRECSGANEICCPGRIHGKTYGKTHACVPKEQCYTVDAGAPDRPRPRDAPDTDADIDGSQP